MWKWNRSPGAGSVESLMTEQKSGPGGPRGPLASAFATVTGAAGQAGQAAKPACWAEEGKTERGKGVGTGPAVGCTLAAGPGAGRFHSCQMGAARWSVHVEADRRTGREEERRMGLVVAGRTGVGEGGTGLGLAGDRWAAGPIGFGGGP